MQVNRCDEVVFNVACTPTALLRNAHLPCIGSVIAPVHARCSCITKVKLIAETCTRLYVIIVHPLVPLHQIEQRRQLRAEAIWSVSESVPRDEVGRSHLARLLL